MEATSLKENKSKDQINFRLSKEMLAEIDEIVKEEKYNNRSELIRQAVREWLKEKRGQREKQKETAIKSVRP